MTNNLRVDGRKQYEIRSIRVVFPSRVGVV